jgi:NADH-quinone oxidoreductase subunit I
MNAIIKYFSDVLNGFISLAKGMKITGKHFAKSYKEIITQQYPENKSSLTFSDRFRAQLYMDHDENNEHRCDACQTCETVCPNGSIEVVWFREEDPETGKKVKVLNNYVYHLGMCTFCNLCVLACPTQAIKMNHDFETAVYDRSELTKILNKPGSKVKKEK